MRTLKEELDLLRFYNTGKVKSDEGLVPIYRAQVITLLTMLETAIVQRDRAIMSVPLSGNSEDRYKNEFNDELLTIFKNKKVEL